MVSVDLAWQTGIGVARNRTARPTKCKSQDQCRKTKTTSPPFVNFEMMFWRHEEHPSSTISTKGLVQGAQQRQQPHSMDKKHHNLCLANVLAPQTVLATLGSGFAQIPTTKK